MAFISRRNFLKLLGAGTVVVALGGLRGLLNTKTNSKIPHEERQPQLASAQQQGFWSAGPNTTVSPLHAALLDSGKIFYLAGSGWNYSRQFGPFEARVFDFNTAAERNFTQSEDLFCSGLTTLADGTILLAGGTLLYDRNPDNCNGRWHGLKSAYEFNPSTESFTKVQDMLHGRWYPTLVTLPDGKVWCYNGYDEYGVLNRLVEIYDPSSKSWAIKAQSGGTRTYTVGSGFTSNCPGAVTPTYTGVGPTTSFYPRAHLMPSGLVVVNGFQREIWSWRPSDGVWVGRGTTSTVRHYGTSFLVPLQNTLSEKGKILVVGGSPTNIDYAVASAEIIDFNASSTANPVIRAVSPLTYRRKYALPVILPNGKLVVFGGTQLRNGQPVLAPEMFDPSTETWQTLPSASTARQYHSVALLLPDGRVWVAGAMPQDGVYEPRTEFFNPDYLFAGARPTISANPTVGGYGGIISISTPNASEITSVSLLRLMNTTHHYDANQRLVWLPIINRGSSSITVTAPINGNLAPPGYYMIHILNSSGIPSAGSIIKIPGTASTSDTTLPTIAITRPLTGVTLPPGSVLVEGTASDNPGGSGVRDVYVQLDTGSFTIATPRATNDWSTWSKNINITNLGNHRIAARATDYGGNRRGTSITITIA
ncbi:MAG TPA: galactose oxidase-like domain-containing protein [Nitrososphaeraceae archaeon]|nr:galactose oxidase-like domain-containing protein [Nitrososphaeraceae archaeon]